MPKETFKRFTDNLMAFILRRLAAWEATGEIFRQITDPEVAKAHDFEVWDGHIDAFYKRVGRIPKEEKHRARQEYLRDFSDIPLAHKKERVRALIDEYESSLANPKGKTVSYIDERRQLLVAIKNEMGEDALLDALSKSGQVNISLRDRLAENLVKGTEIEHSGNKGPEDKAGTVSDLPPERD